MSRRDRKRTLVRIEGPGFGSASCRQISVEEQPTSLFVTLPHLPDGRAVLDEEGKRQILALVPWAERFLPPVGTILP